MLPELRQDMLGLYQATVREYGDVVRLHFAGVDTFAVSHPDIFKHILQDNYRNYRRNQFFISIIRVLVGNNPFTSDGDDWLSKRRLMQPAFHRQRVGGFGCLMTTAVPGLVERWQRGGANRSAAVRPELPQAARHRSSAKRP